MTAVRRLRARVTHVLPIIRRASGAASLMLAAAGAVVAACTLAAPARLAAQEEDDRKLRTLSVSGEGSVQAAPETARLRVGVLSEARTARAASQENATKMQRVVDALRDAGIEASKIQTVQLSIEPAYDYGQPNQPPILRGFTARNVVEASTERIEDLGEILDAVIEVGGNTVEGITFELKDLGAAQALALADAVADARRKAEALASAAGLKLGLVQEINAVYGGGPIPFFNGGVAMMESRARDAAPPPVNPGELTVTSNVQVVYRLE